MTTSQRGIYHNSYTISSEYICVSSASFLSAQVWLCRSEMNPATTARATLALASLDQSKIPKHVKRSFRPSWRTDVWPWWPSSECYWADVLNHVWMISIESTIVLWVYVCSDSVLMWLIFSDPNILRSETFCVTKVLPGRPHWLCLGWLGLVHWLSASQRCEKPWLQHLARVGEAKDRLQPEICFGVVLAIVYRFSFSNFLSINASTLELFGYFSVALESNWKCWWDCMRFDECTAVYLNFAADFLHEAKSYLGFEGLVGDQAPVGFWDPLGLSKDKDLEVFKRLGWCWCRVLRAEAVEWYVLCLISFRFSNALPTFGHLQASWDRDQARQGGDVRNHGPEAQASEFA